MTWLAIRSYRRGYLFPERVFPSFLKLSLKRFFLTDRSELGVAYAGSSQHVNVLCSSGGIRKTWMMTTHPLAQYSTHTPDSIDAGRTQWFFLSQTNVQVGLRLLPSSLQSHTKSDSPLQACSTLSPDSYPAWCLTLYFFLSLAANMGLGYWVWNNDYLVVYLLWKHWSRGHTAKPQLSAMMFFWKSRWM